MNLIGNMFPLGISIVRIGQSDMNTQEKCNTYLRINNIELRERKLQVIAGREIVSSIFSIIQFWNFRNSYYVKFLKSYKWAYYFSKIGTIY